MESISNQLLHSEAKLIIEQLHASSINREDVIREIAESSGFAFQQFKKEDVLKFIDLVILSDRSSQNNAHYDAVFDKIWKNPTGKEYIVSFSDKIT